MLLDIDQDLVNSSLGLYADDAKAIGKIQSENDVYTFQEELHKIYNWASINNLSFNPSKFQIIRYGSNTAIKNDTNYLDNLNNKIDHTESVKDLGVILQSNVAFGLHIQKTITKAYQMSG